MEIGRQVVPAQSRQRFETLIDGSTATAALADPVPEACTTYGDMPGGTYVAATDGFPVMRFMFGGTDTANQTVNYQVVLWYRAQDRTNNTDAFAPVLAAKGVATLGALTYTVTGIGAATNLFADTITNELARDGVSILSPIDDSIAMLEIATRNAEWVEVETDLGTGQSADVFIQRGERLPVESRGMPYSTATVAAGAAGQQELVATPGAGKQLWLYGYIISLPAAAGTYVLESANTDMLGPMGRAKNGGDVVFSPDEEPIFKCATNEALNVTMVGAGATAEVFVRYRTVDVA